MEDGAAARTVFRPNATPVRFDDRTPNRHAGCHGLLLGREKRIKHPGKPFGRNTLTEIDDRDNDGRPDASFRPPDDAAPLLWLTFRRIHRIHGEVENDLLQLNLISPYVKSRHRQIGFEPHVAYQGLNGEELEDIADRLVDIKQLRFEFALLQQTAQMLDDTARPHVVAADVDKDLADFGSGEGA